MSEKTVPKGCYVIREGKKILKQGQKHPFLRSKRGIKLLMQIDFCKNTTFDVYKHNI